MIFKNKAYRPQYQESILKVHRLYTEFIQSLHKVLERHTKAIQISNNPGTRVKQLSVASAIRARYLRYPLSGSHTNYTIENEYKYGQYPHQNCKIIITIEHSNQYNNYYNNFSLLLVKSFTSLSFSISFDISLLL